jgi:NADH-quinone oxidoreductase subunit M
MFNGIWIALSDYRIVFTVFAIIAIILSAVYTLNMIQKIFFGNTNTLTETTHDAYFNERLVLGVLVAIIIVLGVYPQPVLNLGNSFVEGLMKEVNLANLMIK